MAADTGDNRDLWRRQQRRQRQRPAAAAAAAAGHSSLLLPGVADFLGAQCIEGETSTVDQVSQSQIVISFFAFIPHLEFFSFHVFLSLSLSLFVVLSSVLTFLLSYFLLRLIILVFCFFFFQVLSMHHFGRLDRSSHNISWHRGRGEEGQGEGQGQGPPSESE